MKTVLGAGREPGYSTECRWKDPIVWPTLSGDEIHLWYSSLNPQPTDSLARILSQDELARARLIQSVLSKRRFVSGRGILRLILSRYLGVTPEEISFGYGSQGKPFLVKPSEHGGIEFSLSHSKGSMILGITLDQAIGVDAEYSTHLPEAQALARRFFSDEENRLIQSLVGNARDEAFIRIWTGKEAFLKAKGLGLTQRLDEIDIPSQRIELNRFVPTAPSGKQGASLFLMYLEPVSELTVAVVVERANSKLTGWCWI
jgi:4'-phosphopantetheinyl transferase